MDSNDLEACGKKCCYFRFHSEFKFLTRFDVFLGLVIYEYLLEAFKLIFLCIYLGEGRGGGGTLMHVYLGNT